MLRNWKSTHYRTESKPYSSRMWTYTAKNIKFMIHFSNIFGSQEIKEKNNKNWRKKKVTKKFKNYTYRL